MCNQQSCIRRSAEFHIVVILGLIVLYVWLSSDNGEENENVYYDYDDNNNEVIPIDHQRKKKCIKTFIMWMYLLLLLSLSFFTRISDRSYIAMLWITMTYSFFLPAGLVILWPILEENTLNTLGHVAVSRPTAWVTCAFLGLAHLMNLIFYTKKLKMEQDELDQQEVTASILSNKTDA